MLELHLAGDRREHGVIMAQPGARAGEEGHPALPHDDRSRVDQLAVAGLDAEPLADAVAAVLDAAARLLVCHRVYSSFFVARGFLGAAFAVVASVSALAVVFFGAAALVSAVASALALGSALTSAFGSALAFAGAFAAVAFALGSAFTGLSAASFAASSASLAAWAAAASSSRSRSVLALSSACLASLAALLPPNVMSAMRSVVSSWR